MCAKMLRLVDAQSKMPTKLRKGTQVMQYPVNQHVPTMKTANTLDLRITSTTDVLF